VSEQLSADVVAALLAKLESGPREQPLSRDLGIQIVQQLTKVAAELELLRGKPEGPVGW